MVYFSNYRNFKTLDIKKGEPALWCGGGGWLSVYRLGSISQPKQDSSIIS
jgi:hypothetical protein